MSVKLNGKDYIWSYIGVLVSVGSSAIMLPFVLWFLSEDMYGLWSVFQSIVAITALFDFGFSTTFARNINYCWCGALELNKIGATSYAAGSAPNFLLMKRAMSVCRCVFLLLSGIALLCMVGPGTLYIRHICNGLPWSEVLVAWLLYAASVFLNLYYGYYNSFLRGVGAIKDANKVTVLARLIQIGLTVVLLLCGFGIIGTGIAYLVYGFVLRLLSKRAFLRFQGIGKGLDSVPGRTSYDEIWELFGIVWHNAKKEGGVTLANYLANQACTIIAPLFITLHMTGVYSLAVQLATVLSNIAAAMYLANQPVLQSAYITDNRQLMRRTMSLIVVSFVGIFAIGMVCVVVAGLPILRLIKPDSTPPILVMLGMGVYQFVLKFRNCYTSYFSCTNRIPYTGAFITSSVFCVLMAVLLLNFGWGIWGLILAQISSQCAFNVWYWPWKAHREMELSVTDTVRYGFEESKQVIKSVFKGVVGEKDVE